MKNTNCIKDYHIKNAWDEFPLQNRAAFFPFIHLDKAGFPRPHKLILL